MEQELVDLENLSDLDNLLALAEEEFFETKPKVLAEESDCEIITPPPTTQTYTKPSPFIRSITNTITVARNRVQSSISNFFKPPKRLPDEIIDTTEIIEDKVEWKRVKSQSESLSTVSKVKVPKYKLIPGTPFTVDAFSYGPIQGITGFFLTHFHSDHYKGLSNKLFTRKERLYCSEVTGNLVQKELKIKKEVITTLQVGNVYEIEGIKVGVLDANQ